MRVAEKARAAGSVALPVDALAGRRSAVKDVICDVLSQLSLEQISVDR